MAGEAFKERKQIELGAKVAALREVLTTLEAASAPKGNLAENHSQIIAISGSIGGLLDEVETELANNSGLDAQVWAASWPPLEELLSTVHRMFGFFWEKFAQRETTGARDTLLIADDFAQACYAPVRAALRPVPGVPDPPTPLLCFDDSVGGAYVLPYRTPFDRYLRFGRDTGQAFRRETLLTTAQFDEFNALPVPVIAVPWLSIGHLPEMVVIAHEVGHLVARDLEVTTESADGLDLADLARPTDRGAARRLVVDRERWVQETFADVYATACVGVGYGYVLADYLPAGLGAWQDTAVHPAPGTRIQLIVATLRQIGQDADAQALTRWWTEKSGGPPIPGGHRASEEFLDSVCSAFLRSGHERLSGRALTDLPDLVDEKHHAVVAEVLLALKESRKVEAVVGERALLAAVSAIFATDPERYTRAGGKLRDMPTLVFSLLASGRTPTRRGRLTRLPASDESLQYRLFREERRAAAHNFLRGSSGPQPEDEERSPTR